ncbi:serine/threonine-protein kinase [Endozoicomonas arenosclerae]|uniref:serine/threonine-protein kinase n=1 Tax=Endozoicomonas arenosclerae TaxID=1633495 RepID=UPI0007816AAD|nr:serine/threonine-protein kinase [Endozoicomonas arenosclerae]
MANVQKPPQDDSVLYHLRMAAISLGKATSLFFDRARAFSRSVVVVLIPARLKRKLNLDRPPVHPLDQRSVTSMGPYRLNAVLKNYSFPEVDLFKKDFKLRVLDVLDDIAAIEPADVGSAFYSNIKRLFLAGMDRSSSMDEIFELLKTHVPVPYRQRLYVSFLQLSQDCGADLSLSEDCKSQMVRGVRDKSFHTAKEKLFEYLKSELGEGIEGLKDGFRKYSPMEQSFLRMVLFAYDVPSLLLGLNNCSKDCSKYRYVMVLKELLEAEGHTKDAPGMRSTLLASAQQLSDFKTQIMPLLEAIYMSAKSAQNGQQTQLKIESLAESLMSISDVNEAFAVIKQLAPSQHVDGLLTAFIEICEVTGDESQLDASIKQYFEDRENRQDQSAMDLSWSYVSRNPELLVSLKKELVVDIENVIRGVLEEFYANATREGLDEGLEVDSPVVTGAELNRSLSTVSSSGYDTASQLSDDSSMDDTLEDSLQDRTVEEDMDVHDQFDEAAAKKGSTYLHLPEVQEKLSRLGDTEVESYEPPLSGDLEDYVVVPFTEINPEELPDIRKLEALKTSIGSCDSYEDMLRELIDHAPVKYAKHLMGGLSETYQHLKASEHEHKEQSVTSHIPDFPPYDIPRERSEEKSRQDVFDHMQVSPAGDVVGQGSFGQVEPVIAHTSGSARPVKALKTTLNADRSRELEIMARLQHPHIVSVEDLYRGGTAERSSSGEVGFREGIQMEFVGQNLHELIRGKGVNGQMTNSGPLPDSLSKKVAKGLLEAFEYLHTQTPPISHGDLKPNNVLVTADGEAKLADFGAAAFQESKEIGWDNFSGNLVTAPPEFFDQSRGRTTQADMWAFGCVLYEMATGEVLFKQPPLVARPMAPVSYMREEVEKAMAHPELNSPDHLALKDLLRQLLEFDPEKRFTARDALHHVHWLPKP